MMTWAYDQDGWEAEDYRLYIGHVMFVAQKAKSRIYVDEAMVAYDKAIRGLVDKHGLQLFAKGNHDCVMHHFAVENTKQARAQRAAAAASASSGYSAGGSGNKGGGGGGRRPCNHYNTSEGCSYNPCSYAHKCSKCGKPGHNKSGCWGPNGKKE